MKKTLCLMVGKLCKESKGKDFRECYGTVENFAEIAEQKDADFLFGYLEEIKKDACWLMRHGGDSYVRSLYDRARRLEYLVRREVRNND